MKIKLTMDEYWRIYIPRDNEYGFVVEVPNALVERFRAADKEFREAEDALYQLYLAAQKSNQEATDASPNL